MTPTGWFADLSDEEDRVKGSPYQPFLQTAGGCFPLPLWFDSEESCDEFIRDNIAGKGQLHLQQIAR
jgi:hypothetical protein